MARLIRGISTALVVLLEREAVLDSPSQSDRIARHEKMPNEPNSLHKHMKLSLLDF